MKKTINTLKDTVPILKLMGAELGMDITEEDMARKINMPWEQFEAYLNAAGKTPNEVLSQLWVAYDDVLKALQRLNNSTSIKNKIAMVKRLGKEKGMDITDEEIVLKLAIPRELFEAYVSGELPTPEEIFPLFWSAWPDLLKNVQFVSVREVVELEEEEDDDY
jgi:hypothetical protein